MLWQAAEAAIQPTAATTPSPSPSPVGTTAPPALRSAAPEATPVRRAPDFPRHQQQALADRFLEGYRHAGGPPAFETHLIRDVIPCESGWQLDPPGYHLGAAQFDPDTWQRARCSPGADYRDPWEQGCAVGRWINAGIDPGSTAGWPTCWHHSR